MTKKVRYNARGYSVVLDQGVTRFALRSDGCAGRAFFCKYRDAVAFKRALAEHKLKGRVVKVTVRMETAR